MSEQDFENLDNELDETAAADTIKAKPTDVSKSGLIAMAVNNMAGMNHDDLSHLFYDMFPTNKKAEEGSPDASEKNKASIAAKPSGTGANPMGPFPFVPVVKEDVISLFDGQELSEELLEKATTLFESAVNARVVLEVTRIQEDYENKLIEEIDSVREDLTEKVDSYINYVAEEWIAENEVAIENSIRTELVLEFQDKLSALMRENYIDIPEDRIDVVEALSERIVELEEEINKVLTDKIEAVKENEAFQINKVFQEVSEGLTANQVEQFRSLTETIEFNGDFDDLSKKMKIIKEANFKKTASNGTGLLNEEGDVLETEDVNKDLAKDTKAVDPRVARYVESLRRL